MKLAKPNDRLRKINEVYCRAPFQENYDVLVASRNLFMGYMALLSDVVEIAVQKAMTKDLTASSGTVTDEIALSARNSIKRYVNSTRCELSRRRGLFLPYWMLLIPDGITFNYGNYSNPVGGPVLELRFSKTAAYTNGSTTSLSDVIVYFSSLENKIGYTIPSNTVSANLRMGLGLRESRRSIKGCGNILPAPSAGETYSDPVHDYAYFLTPMITILDGIKRISEAIIKLDADAFSLQCEDDDTSSENRLQMLNRRGLSSISDGVSLINRGRAANKAICSYDPFAADVLEVFPYAMPTLDYNTCSLTNLDAADSVVSQSSYTKRLSRMELKSVQGWINNTSQDDFQRGGLVPLEHIIVQLSELVDMINDFNLVDTLGYEY